MSFSCNAARTVAAAWAFGLLSTQAIAATPFTWDGFYVGGNLGFRAGQPAWNGTDGVDPFVYDYSTLGLRAGLHAGYNWQFAPRWVAGVEADAGWADHETRQVPFFPGFAGVFFPLVPGEYSAINLGWDLSLRGRIGFLVSPSTMLFGAAGFTWQRVEVQVLCTCGVPQLTSGHTVRPGWTLGAGVETALAGNWFARAEYRYADLGAFPVQVMVLGATGPVPIEVETHTATFGLSYRFGEHGTPPAAWPDTAPAIQWGGFYLGASAGARFHEANWLTREFGVLPIDDTAFANYNGTGMRGGVLAGHDWQIAPRWLAGVEADLGFADKKTMLPGFLPGVSGVGGPILAGDVSSVRTTWDASLRARLGYLLRPATQVYATGGAAWLRVEANSVCGALTCGTVESSTHRQTLTGWTVGGGIETKVMPRWRVRGEYRYADFGTMRANFTYFGIPDPALVDIRVRTHTAQFGLIYDLN